MMTKEKAFAFVSGFDRQTRTRWFVMLAAYQWPTDLPFFANPLPISNLFENKTGSPLSPGQCVAMMRDPVWRSMRDALAATLPAALCEDVILSSYHPRFQQAVGQFAQANAAFLTVGESMRGHVERLSEVLRRGMPIESQA